MRWRLCTNVGQRRIVPDTAEVWRSSGCVWPRVKRDGLGVPSDLPPYAEPRSYLLKVKVLVTWNDANELRLGTVPRIATSFIRVIIWHWNDHYLHKIVFIRDYKNILQRAFSRFPRRHLDLVRLRWPVDDKSINFINNRNATIHNSVYRRIKFSAWSFTLWYCLGRHNSNLELLHPKRTQISWWNLPIRNRQANPHMRFFDMSSFRTRLHSLPP